MIQENTFVPLVEATRGGIVESIHYGAIAIVDIHGNLFASCGDPKLVSYMRSSSKPLQAIPLLELGGAKQFNLTQQEIAITCASHDGTDMHVEIVRKFQEKTGLQENDLLCGTHPAIDKATAEAMLLRGEKPGPNRHNCSGKHTGFLAQALLRNLSKEDYINPLHPVQQTIIQTFTEMCEVAPEDLIIGIDGCSVPVFALPLENAALGIARLCDPSDLSANRAEACKMITSSMTAYPELIADFNEFDTRLMQVTDGKIITKRGAEGYQIIGLLPGSIAPDSPALGISIKISDGDPKERARPLVSLEVLRQIGALSETQLLEFQDFYTHPIFNWKKIVVGELRPCFHLVQNSGLP
ncbi:MAG: asparaginase [Anaerolineaceae bacterium]